MRAALLVLGASSLALVAVVALTLRDRTTMLGPTAASPTVPSRRVLKA
jgi:hypothetical protein